jgi:SAM-dependent methyltransferase
VRPERERARVVKPEVHVPAPAPITEPVTEAITEPTMELPVTVATEPVAACDLCGGRRFAHRLTAPDLVERLVRGPHTYVRCLECGLCFLCPRPTPADIDKVYPTDYRPHEARAPRPPALWQRLAGARGARLLWPARFFVRTRQLLTHHPIPAWQGEGRILDVGCGSGAFLDTMRQLGWRTHGRDPSPSACALARDKGHDVRRGGAEDLDEPDASFDVVNLNQVLEHTFSPARALRAIRRVLRPGGRLVLALPNFGGLQMRLLGRYSSALDPPRHLYQFQRATLRRYLIEAGFEDVRISTRTGAQSFTKALRLMVNDVFGTRFRREPAWLSAPFELVAFVCGLFGFFGAGRDLRATARKPS